MTRPHPPAPSPATPRVTRAFIDGLEEGTARLLLQDSSDGQGEWRTYKLPAAALPPEAREGDWIELSVRTIPPPAEVARPVHPQRRHKTEDEGDFSL
jgi:hypothetical protein